MEDRSAQDLGLAQACKFPSVEFPKCLAILDEKSRHKTRKVVGQSVLISSLQSLQNPRLRKTIKDQRPEGFKAFSQWEVPTEGALSGTAVGCP